MPRAKAPGVAAIEWDFSPTIADEAQQELHSQVNDLLKKTALTLNKILPQGRHRALAITHLEQAMWAANSSIAHDGRDGSPVSVEGVSQEVSRAMEIRSKEVKAEAEKKVAEAVAPVKAAAAKKVAAKKPAPAPAPEPEAEPEAQEATVTPVIPLRPAVKRVARRSLKA